ncbi:amino acid adenylation domain-containing protein [Rhodococcus fascians]|uniref:non-ribosomal peptide synthetase n=1 Tax=Rhodococcoides fascians TaxID=1828 RepID=UPI0024B6709B|nr:non-ribosomal peptide synthetase [Rhodococcus fascians]MDJ0004851.1 amino acid adenylation domain-containing protein [Rhodococcus fascians]
MKNPEQSETSLSDGVRLALHKRLNRPSDPKSVNRESPSEIDLTPAQERILVECTSNPESAAYNVVHAVRLVGKLDSAALQRAFAAAVRARPAFRVTVRQQEDGRAIQRLDGHVPDRIHLVTDETTDAIMRAAAEHVYDLNNGPLLRAVLTQESSDSHLLVIGIHHLIADGWSLGLLFEDLALQYAKALTTEKLSVEPDRYSDAVMDMIARRTDSRTRSDRQYWHRTLDGVRPLELPRHAGMSVRTGHGNAIRRIIDDDTTGRIRSVAAETGTTPFMILAAASAIHLGRLSGQNDVAMLTAMGARSTQEQDRTVGMFVDTVPLRLRIREMDSFRDLLIRTRTAVLEAQAHSRLPFQDIISGITRAGSEPGTLTEASVNLGPRPDNSVMWTEDLAAVSVATPVAGASTELGYHFSFDSHGCELVFVYATDLFAEAEVRVWLADFNTLLSQSVRAPDALLTQRDMLAPSTRNTVTVALPKLGGTGHSESLIEALRAVEKTVPQQIALDDACTTLTYRQTLSAADEIGLGLSARGIRRGDVVATRLSRGIDRTLAFLGCASIGATYLPLDPNHPPARIESVIAQARPVLIIGTEGSEVSLAALRSDAWRSSDIDINAVPPRPAPAVGDGLYIIFTSGSTGEPKGVVISSGGIRQLANGMGAKFGVEPGDRWLQFAPIAFDASMAELITTLLRGATAVFSDGDALLPGDALRDTLQERRISHVILPPTALNVMSPRDIDVSVSIMVAGESCPPRLVKEWGIERRLLNGYGPTEGTVCSTLSTTLTGDAVRGGSVSIGTPMPQVEVRVLDQRLRPVSIGVRGEIYIAGPSLAWGYLGRQGETAARFVADPWSASGSRMYRTGDLGSWRADGTLDCYGRMDTQVKVRGHRIELGEVEHALERHPGVEHAAAAVQPTAEGHLRLIGYVVGEADVAAVRTHMRASLPAYLVPAVITSISALPLTANGKIDRAALPAPTSKGPEQPTAVSALVEAAHSGLAQRILSSAWSEVLGIENINAGDNFFDLGGDSILALQAVTIARRAGIDLTAAQLMRAESLSALAQEAEVLVSPARTEVGSVPRGGAFPVTPVQQWYFESLTASADRFHQAKLLEVAHVSPARVREAVLHMVDRHAGLRTRYFRSGGSYVGIADDDAFDESALLHISAYPPERASKAIADAESGFDPSAGRLLHVVHVHGHDSGRDRIFVCAHHLAVDAVSWSALIEDLSNALENSPSETTSHSSEVTFAHWAHAFADWAERAALEQQDYWEEIHQEISKRAFLPDIGKGADNTVGNSSETRIALTAAETDSLLDAARRLHATQEELLLAAVATAVSDWTGSDASAFMMETHGRQPEPADLDVSQTVGWFTAQYPLLVPTGNHANEQLELVKKKLSATPTSGLGHGVVWQHSREGFTPLKAENCIGFNYLGRLGSVRRDSTVTEISHRTQPRAAQQLRQHLVEINAWIVDGVLTVQWVYPGTPHDDPRISSVAENTMSILRRFALTQKFPLTGRVDTELTGVMQRYPHAADIYPLAPNQLGMVFHSMQVEGNVADTYLGRFRATISGVRDPEIIIAAWRQLVKRHDVLRTAFTWIDSDLPLQVVMSHAELDITITDARQEVDQGELIIEKLDRFRLAQGIDLESAPLLNIDLVRVHDDTWTMTWRIHHAINDGWSFALLLDELRMLIGAADVPGVGLQEQMLPPRPRYRGYIQWLARQDTSAGVRHWMERVQGLSGPTPLPLGATAHRDARATQFLDWSLSENVAIVLRARARSERVTLGTVANAAWATLLGRYSNLSEVCFGVAVSGRPADLEGSGTIIGPFLNIVPMVIRFHEDLDVWQWLSRLQEEQLVDQSHHHAPLALVQRAAGWGSALFHSIVVVENYPSTDTGHGSVRIEQFSGYEETNYSLMLSVDVGAEFRLQLGYDPEIFSATEVERLRAALDDIFAAIGMAEDTRVTDLTPTVITAPGLTGSPLALTSVTGLAHYVTQFACNHPEAPAVSGRGLSWTYQRLADVAAMISVALCEASVGRGDIVGVLLDRDDVRVVAAYTAIGALGAAFVPLDPRSPEAHITALAASAKVVLTDERDFEHRSVVRIQTATSRNGIPLAPVELSPHDLAYLMPTSGTSGAPKRVLVEAGNVAHMVASWTAEYHLATLTPGVLSVSPMSTDLHLSDMLIALSTGSVITFASDDDLRDPAALADLAGESKAGLLITVPPIATALAFELARRGAASHSLGVMMVGSEGWPITDALDVAAALPNTRVVNAYGSTETTVDSTRLDVSTARVSTDLERFPVMPIGQALPGTTVQVLDHRLRRVPVGGVGECYISGPGVTRGYLAEAGVTAMRFVADPWHPAERMYRTGDRVLLTAEHGLVYLGRDDEQIKIGGVRIDLVSIDTALRSHPDVLEASATIARVGPYAGRIIGYVVTSLDEVGLESLRTSLVSRLPVAAMPAKIIQLQQLPRNSSGSVQRRALPDPIVAAASTSDLLPRTDTERRLLAIWIDVMGRPDSDASASFLLSGGDSLRAIQLVSRIAAEFSTRISPRVVFDTATLRELASAVDAAGGQKHRMPLHVARRSVRDGHASEYPATSAQESLWYVALTNPTGIEYHITTAVRLHPQVDLDRLQDAIQQVVDRHAALRTTFVERDGTLLQHVLPHLPMTLDVVDECSSETAIRNAVAEYAASPFDLGKNAWRAGLFASSSGTILVAVLHHIITDGWSMQLLEHEVSEAYLGMLGGPDPLGYNDYAVWAATEGREAAAEGLHYWRNELVGHRSLELPMTGAVAPGPIRGEVLEVKLDDELISAVRDAARTREVSNFTFFATAVGVVLGRYCGTDDVLIGTPVAGRGSAETEQTVGLFVNTVPLRLRLDESARVPELLKQVHRQVLEALDHGYVPFDQIVGATVEGRTLGNSDLVKVIINYERVAAPNTRRWFTPLEIATPELTHVLSVNIVDDGADLRLFVSTGVDAFPVGFAHDIGDRVVALLRDLSDPLRPMAAIRALGTTEIAAKPKVWCESPSLLDLFKTQAATDLDRVCVVVEDRPMTAGQLTDLSAGMAAIFAAQGVGRGDLVAVTARRATQPLIALLGAWRLGAGIVLLPPDAPAARINAILAEAVPKMVLDDDVELPAERIEGPGTGLSDVAYVIYTSGSTGVPKGVVVTHRQLSHFALGLRDRIYPGTNVVSSLSTAPLTFDAAFSTICAALSGAAVLHLVSDQVRQDPVEVIRCLREQKIDVLETTPTYVARLLETSSSTLSSLQRIVLGGEPIDAYLWEQLSALDCEVLNVYGPTECTVDATCTVLSSQVTPNIGTALPGVQLLVLDRWLREVPIDGVGELYIRGPQVARGYLGRPDQTADRFVADPLLAGARMYRSGDLVRRDRAGALQYLRRNDDQIKLRGQRIEPGEIEAALRKIDGVREAAAAIVDTSGLQQLVGFVVGNGDQQLSEANLLAELRSTLPGYLVPTTVCVLQALPVSQSGKTDRRALSKWSLPVSRSQGRAPETEAEQAVARAWHELLGVADPRVDDDFFALGGDSIRSMQLCHLLEKEGWKANVLDVQEAPTLSALALRLVIAPTSSLSEADRGPQEYELSPVQHEFLSTQPEPVHFRQSVHMRLAADVDEGGLAEALKAIVRRHSALRTAYTKSASGWKAAETEDDRDILVVEDLAHLHESDAAARVHVQASQLDAASRLAQGELVHAILWRMPDAERTLHLTIHHLAVDAVSWGVLLSDLDEIYRALMVGGAFPELRSATPPGQYQFDLREVARRGDFDADSEYWQRTIDMPIPRGPVLASELDTIQLRLTGAVYRNLATVLPSQKRLTLRDSVLAALVRGLCDALNISDLALDVESHGREQVEPGHELARSVGWFTTVAPVFFTAVAGSAVEAARQARKELRRAPRNGLAYGVLRDIQRPEASLQTSRSSVMFNYHSAATSTDLSESALFASQLPVVGTPEGDNIEVAHPIELVAVDDGFSLIMNWIFARNLLSRSLIDKIAERAHQFLVDLSDEVSHDGAS